MTRIRVVADTEVMKKFFDEVMIPLQDDWVYTVLGVARKKYSDDDTVLTRSEEALMRDLVVDYDFDRLVRFLKRMEVDEECYVDRNSGCPIPWTAMAYYIDLRPKSASKATAGFLKDYMDDLTHVHTDPKRLERLRRIKPHIFSHASRNNATKKHYMIIDIDIKDMEILKEVVSILNGDAIPIKWVSETRGGYHIIVPVGTWLKDFYKSGGTKDKLAAIEWPVLEFLGHCQTPIPGTYQGGHVVRWVDLDHIGVRY